MHLDVRRMLRFVDESVCLRSWDWSASGTTACLFDRYLVVLTLSWALKVVSNVASLVTDTDASEIDAESLIFLCLLGIALDTE